MTPTSLPPQSKRLRPAWAWPLLLAGVFAVSTGALFVRFADPAPALAKAAWRCGLAALILLAIGRRSALRTLAKLPRGQQRQLLLAGFFLALHFGTWILSLSYTTVASSLFLVTTTPAWTALLAPLIIGERTRREQWLGSGICLFGAAILGWGEFSVGGTALFGDFLAILGAISFAVFLILGRQLQRQVPGLPYLLATYSSAAFFLISTCLFVGIPLINLPSQTYPWLILLALVPQLLGHSAYNLSLRHFSAATVSIALAGEPVLGSLIAWTFIGEPITAVTCLGGFVLLAGIFIATYRNAA